MHEGKMGGGLAARKGAAWGAGPELLYPGANQAKE
jgi:hypothetical protein